MNTVRLFQLRVKQYCDCHYVDALCGILSVSVSQFLDMRSKFQVRTQKLQCGCLAIVSIMVVYSAQPPQL